MTPDERFRRRVHVSALHKRPLAGCALCAALLAELSARFPGEPGYAITRAGVAYAAQRGGTDHRQPGSRHG